MERKDEPVYELPQKKLLNPIPNPTLTSCGGFRTSSTFSENSAVTVHDTGVFGGKARGLPLEVSRPAGFYDMESLE